MTVYTIVRYNIFGKKLKGRKGGRKQRSGRGKKEGRKERVRKGGTEGRKKIKWKEAIILSSKAKDGIPRCNRQKYDSGIKVNIPHD